MNCRLHIVTIISEKKNIEFGQDKRQLRKKSFSRIIVFGSPCARVYIILYTIIHIYTHTYV